ncbi:SDR family oxidoreductase [Synechococcus sp. MIT S1220]|uniref:SDR family oxidoreductase n=1 Tax=Synechococcus sp. MIT S1220 TaxID=3082549 RepID=UPI0039AFC2B1
MSVFLVTGANRGIGLEYCRQLKSRGDTVIAVCRETSADLGELDVRIEQVPDLSQQESIADLIGRLNGLEINTAILNAGINHVMDLNNLDPSSIRQQFDVNALAPLLLASALIPSMSAGGKLVFMSSRMGSIQDNTSGGEYGYRMSKAALNSAVKSLSIDLKDQGISVGVLHPGMVQTRMNLNSDGIPPQEAVSNLLDRIGQLSLETTGSFWHAEGKVLPW